MAKRAAEVLSSERNALKDGRRQENSESVDEVGVFEDEFEDEFESEEEIFEAGADGRPDEEEEGKESRGMWFMLASRCEPAVVHGPKFIANSPRCHGFGSTDLHTRTRPSCRWRNTFT